MNTLSTIKQIILVYQPWLWKTIEGKSEVQLFVVPVELIRGTLQTKLTLKLDYMLFLFDRFFYSIVLLTEQLVGLLCYCYPVLLNERNHALPHTNIPLFYVLCSITGRKESRRLRKI